MWPFKQDKHSSGLPLLSVNWIEREKPLMEPMTWNMKAIRGKRAESVPRRFSCLCERKKYAR